jgi:hypothetical protein
MDEGITMGGRQSRGTRIGNTRRPGCVGLRFKLTKHQQTGEKEEEDFGHEVFWLLLQNYYYIPL